MRAPTTISPLRIRSFEDITLEALEAIAYDRAPVELDPELLDELATQRAQMLVALQGGTPVYGATTGTGYLSKVELDGPDEAEHSANLLLGRAVGSAPFLPRAEARALMVAKLVSLVSGHAGVSPDLCAFIVERLNDDFVPAVPRTAAGCAGEVSGTTGT